MKFFENSVLQHLSYIVLEPIEKPSVEQIKVFQKLAYSSGENMLEIRQILVQGGFAAFGELLDDQAKAISSNLSEAGIPHRIEKTPLREIIFPKGKQK